LVGREPSTLLVQDEMVNQEKDLAHTTAGADLMRELREKGKRHTEALEELCVGIEAARLAEDEETKEILQDEARKARERVERIRGDLERMVANFATENLRLENENRRYKKDFKKQQADVEHKTQLLEEERRARELAEEGRRRVEAELAAERESRERELKEEEREQERRERERREKQEREKSEKQKTGSICFIQ